MEFTQESAIKSSGFVCDKCGMTCTSRNKLFKHVKKECGVEKLVLFKDNKNSFCYDNWYIFAVGGRLRGRTLASCEKYSFENNNWIDTARMIEHRGSHTAVAYNNEIIVFGGGGFNSNLSSCEKYNVVTNSWSNIAQMQTLRHAHSCARVADNVYIVGGWVNGSECITDVEVYNIGTDSWKTVAPLITPRRLHGSTSVLNKLYVFGGNASNNNHLVIEKPAAVTDTDTDTDTGTVANVDNDPTKSKSKSKSKTATATEWYTNHAESYDVSTDTWTAIPNMPFSGPCNAIGITPEAVQATAASTSTGPETGYVFVFVHGKRVVRYDVNTMEYTLLAPLPMKEWYCFDVMTMSECVTNAAGTTDTLPLDGKIYLVGGAVDGAWSKSCYAYVIDSDTWEEMPSMRLPRRRCAAVLMNNSNVYDTTGTIAIETETETTEAAEIMEVGSVDDNGIISNT